MKTERKIMIWLCLLAFQGSLVWPGIGAWAQAATSQQLAALVPDEQDLQGFLRMRPAGESPPQEVFQNGQWVEQQSPPASTEDKIQLNVNVSKWIHGWAPLSGRTGTANLFARHLYSIDGVYHIEIDLSLCPSSSDAKDELTEIRQASSGVFVPGSFTSAATIGDESWVLKGPNVKHLLFRSGNLVIHVSGSPSSAAFRRGVSAPFPPSAVEAVAYQILLRASREAGLTGIPAHDARLAVNDKPPFGQAFTVAHQTYVPVVAFAQAMGYASRWDAKTGGLTLSRAGRKPISVTAGSLAATVGAKAVALKTPVLKQDGQPVMTLSDLLTLVNGRAAQQGGTIQVKA